MCGWHLHNFIIFKDRPVNIDYIFVTIEEEMEVHHFRQGCTSGYVLFGLLSQIMSSRVFPAFCAQLRKAIMKHIREYDI
jgi:hypothetical protein